MSETRFEGVRVRYDSARSYDELVSALLADIGDKPVPINELARETGDWDSYRERVESYVGPSGFMLFSLLDHGGWIAKAGIDRKVLRARVVECVFEERKGAQYKVVSFFAKRARGLMARWAAQHRAATPRRLEAFDAEGYAFAPAASEPDRLVFRRHAEQP